MWHRVMGAGAVTDHDKAGVPAISMYHQPWWGLPRVLGSGGDGMLSVADNELHRSRVYSWMDSSHVLINYGPFLSLQSVPPCPSLAVAYHVCPLSGQRNLCSDFPFGESTRWYITSYRENAPCIWLPSLRALLRFAPTLSEQRFILWAHWRLFICSLAELFSAFLHCVKASESVLVKVFLWVYIFGFTRNGVDQRYEYVYV